MNEDQVRAIVREELTRAIADFAAQATAKDGAGSQIGKFVANLVDFDTLDKTVDTMLKGMERVIVARIKAYDEQLPTRIVSMMNNPTRRR